MQADFTLSNQSRTSFRAELNTTFEAVATQNSGPTAPTTTYPFQVWADTTESILKFRNSTNTAWLPIMRLDINGGRRTNAGNPNGTVTGSYQGEPLYDTTNNVLYAYTGTGTVWRQMGGRSEVLIETLTASGAGVLSFDFLNFPAEFSYFTLRINDLRSVNDGTQLQARLYNSGGLVSTAATYSYTGNLTAAGAIAPTSGSASATSIVISHDTSIATNGLGNAAGEAGNFLVTIENMASASARTAIRSAGGYRRAAGDLLLTHHYGERLAAEVNTGLNIALNSGNLTGTLKLFGHY